MQTTLPNSPPSEDQMIWLQRKVESQAATLLRLQGILAASKRRDLAGAYVNLKAAFDALAARQNRRDKTYTDGYVKGWSQALNAIRGPLYQTVPPEAFKAVDTVLEGYCP